MIECSDIAPSEILEDRMSLTEKRFVDNGDGTITDNETGLMWQQDDESTERSFHDALGYYLSLTLGGHSDWRLPSLEELESLLSLDRQEI